MRAQKNRTAARRGDGRYPFGGAMVEHLRRYLGERAAGFTAGQVVAELAADLARELAAESGESSEGIAEAEQQAREKTPVRLTLTRRTRYWSAGAILGSRLFIVQMTTNIFGRERAESRRFAHTKSPSPQKGRIPLDKS